MERAAAERGACTRPTSILVIDSDVPWIPTVSRPNDAARIFHIDVDPLKQQMPLWYIAAKRVFRADAATALRQLNAALDAKADRRRRRVASAPQHYAEHARASAPRTLASEERSGGSIHSPPPNS